MNTADRRAEIINILLVRRRITAKELADEFNVTVRTIQNDIQALYTTVRSRYSIERCSNTSRYSACQNRYTQ